MKTIKQLEEQKRIIEEQLLALNNINAKQVTCLTCGYSWATKSQKVYVNCPSCRSAVQLNILIRKNEQSN